MRIASRRAAWVAGIAVAAALAGEARAQGPGRRPLSGPLAVYYYRQALVAPTCTNIGVQTSVAVPDGGTAALGGYGRVAEGRTQYGVPGVGGVPYLGRGFRNVGYGRSTATARVSASVRIIDLHEEEFRQTGVRSRP
jgi:Flp pilus assembly secretin CpaC